VVCNHFSTAADPWSFRRVEQVIHPIVHPGGPLPVVSAAPQPRYLGTNRRILGAHRVESHFALFVPAEGNDFLPPPVGPAEGSVPPMLDDSRWTVVSSLGVERPPRLTETGQQSAPVSDSKRVEGSRGSQGRSSIASKWPGNSDSSRASDREPAVGKKRLPFWIALVCRSPFYYSPVSFWPSVRHIQQRRLKKVG